MPPPSSPHARWFHEQVLPNEPKLRAWLRTRFPTLPDVDDLIQETYARIFRSDKAGLLERPQAYLYATARNCAFDRLRHAEVAKNESLENSGVEDVLVEEAPDPCASLSHAQEIDLLCDAIEALPERCRHIVKLRKIEALSYDAIAVRLGLSERTVNAQLALGMAKLRLYLKERGLP